MKNNPELVEALCDYEKAWGKGKYYLREKTNIEHPEEVDAGPVLSHIQLMSCEVEALAERYSDFNEALICRDYEIFMQIPNIVILNVLKQEIDPESDCS